MVQQVLETEKKAEALIKQAEKKKQHIIEKAKQDALGLISEQQKKIDEEQDAFLQEQQETIDKKKQHILEEGDSQIVLLENTSKKHIPKATAFVLKLFKEAVEKP